MVVGIALLPVIDSLIKSIPKSCRTCNNRCYDSGVGWKCSLNGLRLSVSDDPIKQLIDMLSHSCKHWGENREQNKEK